LIDLDRTGFPNLALMKLSAWHKAQGDEVTLVPGRPVAVDGADVRQGVRVGGVFVEPRESRALAALGVIVGGKGYQKGTKLPPDVFTRCAPDYTLYGIDYGMGFLVRGCIRDCAFCSVPQEEGLPWLDQTIDGMLNPSAALSRADGQRVLLEREVGDRADGDVHRPRDRLVPVARARHSLHDAGAL
jgi:hypothetical protein